MINNPFFFGAGRLYLEIGFQLRKPLFRSQSRIQSALNEIAPSGYLIYSSRNQYFSSIELNRILFELKRRGIPDTVRNKVTFFNRYFLKKMNYALLLIRLFGAAGFIWGGGTSGVQSEATIFCSSAIFLGYLIYVRCLFVLAI